MNNGFSLFEQTELNNQPLTVTYRPQTYVNRYTYDIIQDGKVVGTYSVTGNKASEIYLDQSGEFQIRVTLYNGSTTKKVESGTFLLDMDKPIIRLKDTSEGNILTVSKVKSKENFSIHDYIIATDNHDGDVTSHVTSNIDELDVTKTGLYDLTYTVTDTAGNIAEKTVHLHIVANPAESLFGLQLIILTILVVVSGMILRYRHSLKLEKRVSKYSVDAIDDHTISIFDQMGIFFQKWNHRLSLVLSKSVFLKKYGERYEKYVVLSKSFYQSGMDFVAMKLTLGLGFIGIALLSKTIQYQLMSVYESFFPFLVGFFLLDILYYSKYKIYRNTLENDLLQAIIIMNNAFKSGRSITQAIDLVTHELKGPIGEEYKKMSLELSFGLSIDQVFKRLSDRIGLEEITYLTASLTILNQTGGNIIQVFNSIEKSLFNKKKLKLELASLTGSSKMIVYVLYVVPLLFVAFISLVSPSYFAPFYTTTIGLIFLGIMIVIYVAYIWVVQKIMKVRM